MAIAKIGAWGVPPVNKSQVVTKKKSFTKDGFAQISEDTSISAEV